MSSVFVNPDLRDLARLPAPTVVVGDDTGDEDQDEYDHVPRTKFAYVGYVLSLIMLTLIPQRRGCSPESSRSGRGS